MSGRERLISHGVNYEHIIRNEDQLHRIRQYILHNPSEWTTDRENPAAGCQKPEDPWPI